MEINGRALSEPVTHERMTDTEFGTKIDDTEFGSNAALFFWCDKKIHHKDTKPRREVVQDPDRYVSPRFAPFPPEFSW